MKVIYKYPVGSYIEMPIGAEIIHVDSQNGNANIWAIVDPDNQPLPRRFVILGTGHPIDPSLVYVKSCQEPPFVWHLFEVGKPAPEGSGE